MPEQNPVFGRKVAKMQIFLYRRRWVTFRLNTIYKVMPENIMNVMAISPAMIMVNPNPCRPWGTSEYRVFLRMAAMVTMASIHPVPEPAPNIMDSMKV